MKQLKIYFKILYKESLGKVSIIENRQQILLYSIAILAFLFISMSFTPHTSLDYKALNDTIVLGVLQIFSISIISYIFVYLSIDFSYRLDMFFKSNFLNDFNLGVMNKILMFVGIQIISIIIIIIQAGIPLFKILKTYLFIKFIIMTIIGTSIMFVMIDIVVKYLENKYYEFGVTLSKIKIRILSTLSLVYVAIYYTALKVWYNRLNIYDFYNIFANTNIFYYIIALGFTIFIIFIYCFKVKYKIIKSVEIQRKYSMFININKKAKYTKYLKLIIRNKKMLFTGMFIIACHLLNYFTVSDLAIANIFSFFSVILGINFYSYLTHELIFLKIYNDNDQYKIYLTLIFIYLILNLPFIVLTNENYIYFFESFAIYISSIYIGIVFPRENNSLNKFMSNFSLTIIVMALAISSAAISNDNIKLIIYLVGIIAISIIIIKTIRGTYEIIKK